MVVAGLVGVVVGMTIVAWRSMCWTLAGRHVCGLTCVTVAGLACFAAALLLGGPLAVAAVTGAALVGFALAFGGGDPDGRDDDEPPWWPSFEDELRRYERSRRSPVRPRRG